MIVIIRHTLSDPHHTDQLRKFVRSGSDPAYFKKMRRLRDEIDNYEERVQKMRVANENKDRKMRQLRREIEERNNGS